MCTQRNTLCMCEYMCLYVHSLRTVHVALITFKQQQHSRTPECPVLLTHCMMSISPPLYTGLGRPTESCFWRTRRSETAYRSRWEHTESPAPCMLGCTALKGWVLLHIPTSGNIGIGLEKGLHSLPYCNKKGNLFASHFSIAIHERATTAITTPLTIHFCHCTMESPEVMDANPDYIDFRGWHQTELAAKTLPLNKLDGEPTHAAGQICNKDT